MVAIPYLKRASTDKMIYDRVISTIYQVVVSVIFSILLGGGISLSLLAIESLFSVDIVNEWYPTIWLLAFSLVGIISLVDGIAGEDLDGKEEKTTQKWKSMLALVLSILLLIF